MEEMTDTEKAARVLHREAVAMFEQRKVDFGNYGDGLYKGIYRALLVGHFCSDAFAIEFHYKYGRLTITFLNTATTIELDAVGAHKRFQQ